MTEHGPIIDELVELVDIFPTLVDLAGFPASSLPRCDDNTNELLCHEGASMKSLVYPSPRATKTGIFSMQVKTITDAGKGRLKICGVTIMDKEYRYTAWVGFQDDKPVWDDVMAEELYDHNVDREETVNVAGYSTHAQVRLRMRHALKDGWRKALISE